MKKKRLDEILIERGIVKDKQAAFIWVTEGRVFTEGHKAISPAEFFVPDIPLRIKEPPRYVGRAGHKLAAAFEHFPISIEGKICADIGAATGGFTEVLLERGAKKVYAIDAGKGKLALKLREDSRVTPLEETNILYLDSLPDPIGFATIDVSFTSLRLVLPALKKFLLSNAEVIALFKPQYEVDDALLTHGIVESDEVRERAFHAFTRWANESGWQVSNSIPSPIRGAKGNVEYLVHLISNLKPPISK